MIPLRDNIPSKTFPIVTYVLIGLNIAAFVYEISLGPNLEGFFNVFGVVPERTMTIVTSAPRYVFYAAFPFFTSIFLHGGWLHLLGNMLYLYIFGNNVEDALGRSRYVVFYLACGIAASVMHLATNPTSNIPTIGASGAIAGVMGAYFLLYPRAKVVTIVPIFFFIQIIEIPAFFFLGFWFLIQFASGSISLMSQGGAYSGVAWWAHIGGFLAGSGYVVYRFGKRILKRDKN